jgi:hypothetical protein
MSVKNWWRNLRHDNDDEYESASPDEEPESEIAPIEDSAGMALSWATPDELARIEEMYPRSVAISTPEFSAAALDSLVPLAANAGQAAREYSMAVVKFPEGVGWADLCARHTDGWQGWKLLSSIGPDGKFNEMAAIRQAGLTPVGAANLALQAGAVAVGMAYMNQINRQLTALQEGVGEVLKEMAFERDAALKTALDDLRMLGERQHEFLATPEKRAQALQIADRARHDANEAWNYQLSAIRDWGEGLAKDRRAADEGAIRGKIAELAPLEARAAYAYKLVAMAERISMGIESDYTAKRIEGARKLAKRLEGEYEAAIGPIETDLLNRISKIGGLPLLVADAEDDGYEPQNPVFDVAHEIGRQANRLNPFRMVKAAEDDLSSRKIAMQGQMFLANEVARAEDAYEGQLDDLDFAFNGADALLIGDGQIRAISTREKGEGDKGEGFASEAGGTE